MKRVPLLPIIIGAGFGSRFWSWMSGTASELSATVVWPARSFHVTASVVVAGLCSVTNIIAEQWAI